MTNASTLERYTARFPKSKAMFERALHNQTRGVSHDAWYLDPFPVYMHGAKGSRMWDVDGYEYIDYFGGHGALMLGHAHPSLVAAVNGQITKGTHYGASHDLQVEWAEIVKKLVPCAERVEFTNSGTEANMLAMRLARAFTGREKIVRFRG
ncbi:MAG: aminotransferase class III-fold pyridoxal phosphate-dependent enzyme, partial [Deltaproteobacteria bacterium]|nr:aminotransferase class III-fold pyridoxal phosphate-dependent enzyme [Deltaproteobacteria bacterium]